MDQTGEDLVEVQTSDTHFLWLKKNEWKRLGEFGIKRKVYSEDFETSAGLMSKNLLCILNTKFGIKNIQELLPQHPSLFQMLIIEIVGKMFLFYVSIMYLVCRYCTR